MRVELKLSRDDAVFVVWRKDGGAFVPDFATMSSSEAEGHAADLCRCLGDDGAFFDLYLRVARRSVVKAEDDGEGA